MGTELVEVQITNYGYGSCRNANDAKPYLTYVPLR